MSDPMNDPSSDVEPRRTQAAHNVTVQVGDLLAAQPRMRAACVCGWTSEIVPTPAQADARGQAHIASTIEAQQIVEWSEDGTSLVFHRPADFDAEQWRQMRDRMTAWCDDYFAALVEKVCARQAGA